MRQSIYTVLLGCLLFSGCVFKNGQVGPGCDVDCVGGTPVCDELGGVCVECVGDSECMNAAEPFCLDRSRCAECRLDTDCDSGDTCVDGVCGGCENSTECGAEAPVCRFGECVGCDGNEDCGGTTPLCDTSAGSCGECVEDDDCALGVCSVGECVECADNSDCGVSEPRCNPSTNRCEGCASAADCGGATPTCDSVSGRCGACTAATEASACGGNTCDVTTLTCTTTPVGTVPSCGECVADSDCSQAQGTARCVETQYMGADDGYHCLLLGPTCTRPFSSTVDGVSISGVAEAAYCTVDPSIASCGALEALRDAIACGTGSATECGANGAVCAAVGASPNRCTYACNTAGDCPGTLTCTMGTCGS